MAGAKTQGFAKQVAAQGNAIDIDPADAVWLLCSLAALHQKSCDVESLARECVPPVSLAHLLQLGDRLGLDISIAAVDGTPTLDRLPVAAQVLGSASQQPEWAIVLSGDATNVTVIARSGGAPTIVPTVEFAGRLTGLALRSRPKVAQASDPDNSALASRNYLSTRRSGAKC